MDFSLIFRLTPILNIAQIVMNEPVLMNAVVNLPEERNFLKTVVAFYTHKRFNNLTEHFNTINANLPKYMQLMKDGMDLTKAWTGTENWKMQKSDSI